MTYYRLRDIKTPPFAYVTNKEEVVRVCHRCEMPYRDLQGTLRVEIITGDGASGETRLSGRPVLADHWLIGDVALAAVLEARLPGMFRAVPVRVSTSGFRSSLSSRGLESEFFYFHPCHAIAIEASQMACFSPVRCHACHREIQELPLDFEPIPDLSTGETAVVTLRDFFMEGYGYLFHEDVAEDVRELFPEMILEKAVAETLYI